MLLLVNGVACQCYCLLMLPSANAAVCQCQLQLDYRSATWHCAAICIISFLSHPFATRTWAQITLPFPFALLPYSFRLRCYLTVSVCTATLPFLLPLLPYRFRLHCYLTVSVCRCYLTGSVVLLPSFPFAAVLFQYSCRFAGLFAAAVRARPAPISENNRKNEPRFLK
ncbi:hypothetical protein MmiAt1_12990 [Methanimicrococcus sp. At1]|uniref:Uncharacterized protein n=1 Tax=Methanimicrococcus hacksteinii TaxID=3028293 RepID=A0ABU3VS36_9EURY|nr:hypothetical protein [Methanimicrococcus sp. At1]